jgi:hypothetical protein
MRTHRKRFIQMAGKPPTGENGSPMPRPGWILVVLIALLTAVLLLLAGYVGYAGLSVAVGASAAINLL